MKKLKLDHNLATAIRNGEKTSTWRMYDDKDISVNDALELIDKVKPNNPESWQPFGIATVHTVIEKRLNDITEADIAGHGHIGKERIRLKDHANVALVGWFAGEVHTVHHDAARSGVFEAGDHAQRRRLAAAAGP